MKPSRTWLLLSLLAISTLTTRAASTPVPNVPFNHVFLVLPAESFDALAKSAEWRTLAHVEQRTTSADGESWTGLYLYLDNGYLELLRDDAANKSAGSIGIALSVDRLSELGIVNDQLKAVVPGLQRATRKKQEADTETPWFEMLFSTSDEAGFGLPVWVMAYRPEFFRAKGRNVEDGAPLTVQDFAQLVPRAPAAPACTRVRSLRLSLPIESVAKVGKVLETLGWSRKGSLTSVDYSHSGFTLSLLRSKLVEEPKFVDTTWVCATEGLEDSQPAPGIRIATRPGSVTWIFR
jgi:hypothetical protein